MKQAIDHVIHAAMRHKDDELNIYHLPYNGVFEQSLVDFGVKFYGHKKYVHRSWECDTWPIECNWLPEGRSYIPNRLDLDGVIVNTRQDGLAQGLGIADQFHLQLMIYDHELPATSTKKNLRQYVNSRLPKNGIIIYPHDIVKEEWDYPDSIQSFKIPYGIPSQFPEDKTNDVLIVGDYDMANLNMLNEMMNSHDQVKALGFNAITEPYDSFEDLLNEMRTSKVCVAAFSGGHPPLLSMWAAACRCAIVTNKTRYTEAVFGDSALFFEKLDDIQPAIKEAINNHEALGEKAYRVMFREYDFGRFRLALRDLISDLSTKVYTR